MEINRIKQLRNEMEGILLPILRKFEEETGVRINEIRFGRELKGMREGKIEYVTVETFIGD